jgi:hypothetical protein
MGTFANRYCEQHNLPREDFDRVVFRRALPNRVRLIAPLIAAISPTYFAPDFDFVRDIGAMRQPSDFKWALADFRSHTANREFLRRQLRLRTSVSRMRRVIESVPAFFSNQARQELPLDPETVTHD